MIFFGHLTIYFESFFVAFAPSGASGLEPETAGLKGHHSTIELCTLYILPIGLEPILLP